MGRRLLGIREQNHSRLPESGQSLVAYHLRELAAIERLASRDGVVMARDSIVLRAEGVSVKRTAVSAVVGTEGKNPRSEQTQVQCKRVWVKLCLVRHLVKRKHPILRAKVQALVFPPGIGAVCFVTYFGEGCLVYYRGAVEACHLPHAKVEADSGRRFPSSYQELLAKPYQVARRAGEKSGPAEREKRTGYSHTGVKIHGRGGHEGGGMPII